MNEYDRLRQIQTEKLQEAEKLRRLRDFHLQECFKQLEECAKQLGEFARIMGKMHGN